MEDTERMWRVLCGHRWNGLDEWVDCLYRLASLSDEEIHQLFGGAAPGLMIASRLAAPAR